MSYALIGPPGAGKSTQAFEIVEHFKLAHIDSGNLFREKLRQRVAVGLLARRYMAQGELVPDEVVDAMIEERLWHTPPERKILFDGFPRTVYQARFLDRIFEEMNRSLQAVIYLAVDDVEATRRLGSRLTCRTCQTPYHPTLAPPEEPDTCDRCGDTLYRRPDDIPEIVRVRMRAFRRVTGPLLDYYQADGRLIILDGNDTMESVTARIIAAMSAVQAGEFASAPVAAIDAIKESWHIPKATEEEDATLNLVILGGPGSGKGTQAEQLREHHNLVHISTGELFRKHMRQETELGKLARTYIDAGKLVPDDVTEAMVEKRLAALEPQQGFLLDGFPRTLPQAEALMQILDGLGRWLDGVLYLHVSDDVLMERLLSRGREDDTEETIKTRLKTFHSQTAPLVSYYRNVGILININGEGEIEEIENRIEAAVEGVLAQQGRV